jgi:multiple sugar transport system permease protein
VNAERQKAKQKAKWRRRRLVLLLMSPWLIGFTVFFGYPLVANVYFSFTHYDLLSSPRWIGFANYRFLFNGDAQIGNAAKNTVWMLLIAVPLQVMFAFGVAAMLIRARRGLGFFRTVFYLPALAPPVAATLGFVYLLNPAYGPVNTVLGKLGITGPLWFQSPSWSKPSLVLLALWGVGNMMIIFMAALLDVPRHLYESADLDGAGWFNRLRYVTLPTVSPVILFSVIVAVIESLQYFTQGYVAATTASGTGTGAGDNAANNLGYPEGSTLFYPVWLYQQGFGYFNMGYAAAMSVMLLLAALVITLVLLRGSRRFVHYQGLAR